LDSVIVGRRSASKSSIQIAKSTVDVDSIRDFLDKKVAAVGKKEATADKLAHEWEDHLELLTKKQELTKLRASKEAKQNIEVELKYKEERIRKLAEQLGKQPISEVENADEIFFDDEDFQKVLPEASTLAGAKLTSRILFGMVVRERRRVASLARTASTLNERAKSAERTVTEKDVAFRSYRDEERTERAALAQNQQEQILSLMALVQDDTTSTMTAMRTDSNAPDKQFAYLSASMPNITQSSGFGVSGISSRLTVLANERVEALERQVRELRDERESMQMYKTMEANVRTELHVKNEECENLRKETAQLHETLRRLRQVISNEKFADEHAGGLHDSILDIVTTALKKAKKSDVVLHNGGSQAVGLPRLESDSDDEDVPEWAGDIMADLAVIAEGHIPESLLTCPEFEDKSSSKDMSKGTVFDRLTNPNNFTGVQKRKNEQNSRRNNQARSRYQADVAAIIQKKQEERNAISQKLSDQLIDFFQGREPEPALSSSGKGKKSTDTKDEVTEHRSVFERLLSPSMYTGTQKEKLQNVQAKKSQKADEILDELLSPSHQPSSPSSAEDRVTQAEMKEIEIVDITTLVANKVSEYTQKDVFERLQANTTQSYAVKHNPPPSTRIISSPPRAENERPDKADLVIPARNMSPLRDRSGYTQQNVFERLQRTKTHAFAGKELSKDGEDHHQGS
jgi:hypothetical protein